MRCSERHCTDRIGWFRAAVLGANDGIVSTASLIVGVSAADASRDSVWIAGVAGLVAGAMSMAAGEYVSVSSQSDTRYFPDSDHGHSMDGFHSITLLFSFSWWLIRCDRWGAGCQGHYTNCLLGGSGDGGDAGNRRAVRRTGLIT